MNINRKETIFSNTNITLMIILLVGAFLRFYGIGFEDLWLDEVSTVWFGSKGYGVSTAVKRIITDLQGPLYFIIIHFWLYVIDVSEATMRIPSAIFGTISIFAIYKLGKYLCNKQVGIYSALILSVSRINFYYSQEARTYTLSTLLTIISFYYFIKFLSESNKFNLGLYIIFTTLLIYTNYFFLIIILPQSFYYLWHYNKNLSVSRILRWIGIQSIILICLIPAIYILFNYQLLTQNISRGPFVNYMTLIKILKLLSGPSFVFLLFLITSLFAFAANPMITKWCRSLPKLPNNVFLLKFDNKKILLISWLFIPILTLILVGLFYKTIFFPRYFIVCSPALFVLVAIGIDNLRRYSIKIVLLSLITFLSLLSIFSSYKTDEKPRWKDALIEIEENYRENDLVIIYPAYLSKPFNYYSKHKYYSDESIYNYENRKINVLKIKVATNKYSDEVISKIKSSKNNNIWLISPRPDEKINEIDKILSKKRSMIYRRKMADRKNLFISFYSTNDSS